MLRIKILVPIIVGVGGGVIVGLLASQLWNPSWNPFGMSAEQILERSMGKLMSVESFKTQGNITLSIKSKSDELGPLDIIFDFSGKTDQSNPTNIKNENELSVKFGIGKAQISGKVLTKTVDNIFYFNLAESPTIPFFGAMFKTLENQWVRVTQEDLTSEVGKEQEKFNFLEEIKQILEKRKIISVKKDLGRAKIDDSTVYHYLLEVNREELKKAIPEFLKRIEQYVPKEEKTDYQQRIEEFLDNFSEQFDQIYDKVGDITFEVWIEKGSLYLKKIEGEKMLDLSKFEQFQNTEAANAEIKISFNVKFSEFGERFDIRAPEGAKPLKEIMPPVNEDYATSSLFGPPSSAPQPLPGE